jgi:hypothetical protein
MNKHIFSLTLLLSVPHAVMCGTVTPPPSLAGHAGKFLEKIVDDIPDQVLEDSSKLYTRLNGLSDEMRMKLIVQICIARHLDPSKHESEVLVSAIGHMEYETARAVALRYTSDYDLAERVAKSQQGNTEAALKGNPRFTVPDIKEYFGHEQHKKVVKALSYYSADAGRFHTRLPTLY